MSRIALPLIPSRVWQGGFNYVRNLVVALRVHSADQLQARVMRYTDSVADDVRGMEAAGAQFVSLHRPFKAGRIRRIAWSMLTGRPDKELANALKQDAIDAVLEVADFYGDAFPLGVLAWFPDLQHRCLPQYFRGWSYWQRELGFQRQIRASRSILLSSAAAEEDCLRFYPQAKGHTHVAKFAIPLESFPKEAQIEFVRSKHELDRDYFFMPNQYWLHKNHSTAMEALAILRDGGMRVQIATCGNPLDPKAPGHYEALQERVRAMGLDQQFRFLGRIPTEDLQCLMVGCRALVNPSLFEGWSTTVEEAKAHGIPLLLSNLPVHREQAAGTAEFFAPTDAGGMAEGLKRILARAPVQRTPALFEELRVAAESRQRAFAEAFVRAARLEFKR